MSTCLPCRPQNPGNVQTLAWRNLQDLPWCGPNGTMCAQSLNFSDCLVSCDGFYGDVTQEKQEDGNEKDSSKLQQLLSEYNEHKSGLAKNLVYRSRSPKFSKWILPFPLLNSFQLMSSPTNPCSWSRFILTQQHLTR